MEAAANPYRDAGKYLAVLHATLAEVYHRPDASSVVDGLAKDLLSSASDEERLLFFHAEPIATAEDLTGEKPTHEMYERYSEIVKRFGWIPDK